MIRSSLSATMRLVDAARAACSRSWSLAAPWIARIEPRHRPLAVTPGEVPLGPRAVVFCHFDQRGALAERVRHYIEALRAEDLSVVFVTNSGKLEEEAKRWLGRRCAFVVIRPNLGYDFAAWRDGLAAAALPRAETALLVLANDSVYGPIRPLGPTLGRFDFADADAWGLTDSWQVRYHLQSYFIALGPGAFRSRAFDDFWRGVRDIRSKTGVIRHYEVGLTQSLLRGGVRCRAVWNYVDLAASLSRYAPRYEDAAEPLLTLGRRAYARYAQLSASRIALNPTAELWHPLLAAGFPFIKRELLRDNPAQVPDVAAWLALVRATSPSMADQILRDLAVTLRNTAP